MLRTMIPIAVSLAILVWIFSRFDIAGVLERLSPFAAGVLVPALLVYGALSLWIEGLSLVRVVPGAGLGTMDAARLKAASYLLMLVHYVVGAAALALLLKRRTGLSLADAGGAVLLLTAIDLGMLLLLSVGGIAWLAGDGTLQGGVVVACVSLLGLGLAFLRAPIDLGPLERLRELAVFRAARHTSNPTLAELCLLRVSLVASFIGLGWCSLRAFHIVVPPAETILSFTGVSLVSALPIAFAGLGTGQAAFLYFFAAWGSPEALLAASLSLSAGLIALRAAIGLLFAREYTREAFQAAREVEAGQDAEEQESAG